MQKTLGGSRQQEMGGLVGWLVGWLVGVRYKVPKNVPFTTTNQSTNWFVVRFKWLGCCFESSN